MPKPTIRYAQPNEGPLIHALAKANDLLIANLVDWSLPIGPYWLLAENPSPVGCLMVNPGNPIGRLDMLMTHPALTFRQKALVVRQLSYAGMAVLHTNGSQVVMSGTSQDNKGWQRVLENRGMVFTESTLTGLKRL